MDIILMLTLKLLSTIYLAKQSSHLVYCLIVETNWFYSLSYLYKERPIAMFLSLDLFVIW